jgi:iron complex outermembrane receptor protein
MHDNTGNASLVASHKGRRVDLTFQTAWQKNYRYYGGTLDADFSPADAVGLYNNAGNNYNYSNAWTNEIRFSSSNQVKSHIEWTAGAYHFIQKSPTRQATVFGEDAGLIGAPDKNFAIITNNAATNNGLAAFGNATWHATGAFSITAGLRMDYETRQLTVSSAYEKQPDQPVTLQADTTGKTNFEALSPRLGLQYKTSANSLLFFNYNRGFRSGGLSGISSDPSQVPLWPYKPEYGNMFELGFKAETHNKKLRFGAAAFYNAIRDVQAPQLIMPDAVVVTSNAGKLNTGGFELEMEAKPVRGLHVRYAGGYTYSKFGSLTGVNNGSETDLSGNRQVFTPVHTQFVSAQYNKELGKATLSVRIDYRYFGKQYFDLANTITQDGYGLLNLRAAVGWGQFEIQVWSRNLTNTFYIGYAYDFGAARPGEPQVYGVGLGWQLP